MVVFDNARNHIIARRFVLHDNCSEITVKQTIQVTSASPITDYMWITDVISSTRLQWTGHFINDKYDRLKLLETIADSDHVKSGTIASNDIWNQNRDGSG